MMYRCQLHDQEERKDLPELIVDQDKQHRACSAYLEHFEIDAEDVGGYKCPYSRYYWISTETAPYSDVADI